MATFISDTPTNNTVIEAPTASTGKYARIKQPAKVLGIYAEREAICLSWFLSNINHCCYGLDKWNNPAGAWKCVHYQVSGWRLGRFEEEYRNCHTWELIFSDEYNFFKKKSTESHLLLLLLLLFRRRRILGTPEHNTKPSFLNTPEMKKCWVEPDCITLNKIIGHGKLKPGIMNHNHTPNLPVLRLGVKDNCLEESICFESWWCSLQGTSDMCGQQVSNWKQESNSKLL